MKKRDSQRLAADLCESENQFAKANGVRIWYETFGQRSDPPLLLIMGACCQGILWPREFCEQLAAEKFYVIRYDHRDTGCSTCFDFKKNPYDLFDLTKDAVGLLDALKVTKAHLCGLSMGGPIAELMAVHFPERVLTITLIATSCDFRPSNRAYAGLPAEENTLSRPKDIYLSWMKSYLATPAKNQEEALEQSVSCWRILNGTVARFEEVHYYALHRLCIQRSKFPEATKNHITVCANSEDLISTVSRKVRTRTLIIHGTEDPIFPPDHGAALAQAISQSTYFLIGGLGHVLNRQFYAFIIRTMKEFTKYSVHRRELLL